MRKRLKEIVEFEGRPFSYQDFLDFEVDGFMHKLTHETIRNYFSILTKSREIILAYNCGVAFYCTW